MNMRRNMRMTNEIKQLQDRPFKGVSCWPIGENIDQLKACLIGQEDTPYDGGIFKLDIHIPVRYPFEPPQVRFCTPIYHPNIDSGGRICLDILKMPPKGSWKPVHNVSTVLKSIQILMAEPNPDDPLMAEIAAEFKENKCQFNKTAKSWTQKYAVDEENKVSSKQKNQGITNSDGKRKQVAINGDHHNDNCCSEMKKPR
eukprot:gene15158-16716_t